MPQSITTAPCFIQSPFTILGCPTPTTSISAPATYIDFHQIHHTQLFKLLKKKQLLAYHFRQVFGF
jgi:hypothetical protein